MSYPPRSPQDIAALIAAHPLAWVVSSNFDATVLPLLAEFDALGELRSLVGHYARHNAQVAAFERDPSALILFGGPHGYVSPRLVSQPQWGPTWNYAVVRVRADIVFEPDGIDAALRRLVDHVEPEGGWQVEQMGDRYQPMTRRVIAFRAAVRAVEATFKLGQDERPGTFAEIAAGHPNAALAAAMRAQRDE